MPSDNRRAAAILKGVMNRLNDVEESISSSEGLPNLLLGVDEDVETADTVTLARERTVARGVWNDHTAAEGDDTRDPQGYRVASWNTYGGGS